MRPDSASVRADAFSKQVFRQAYFTIALLPFNSGDAIFIVNTKCQWPFVWEQLSASHAIVGIPMRRSSRNPEGGELGPRPSAAFCCMLELSDKFAASEAGTKALSLVVHEYRSNSFEFLALVESHAANGRRPCRRPHAKRLSI
jgi:hypothetical protein